MPLLYILFVFAAIVLIVVILLQEGKGGGFGQALGEHGQQTFGVGASGINRFTAWTAVVFLGSALTIHVLTRQQSSLTLIDQTGPSVIEGLDTGAGAQPSVPGTTNDGK
jgi:preprotein translocase subunit SecG